MEEPAFYMKNNSLQTNGNIYVIDNFFHLINWGTETNQMILDIGCGDGFTTAELLLPKLPKSVKMLIGCDISENMVKFAKKSYQNKRLDFCQLNLTDSATCKEFGAKFDHIFSFFCFHWIPDHKTAFENIYKLLKPGGDILITFLGNTELFAVLENISRNNRWSKYFIKEMISPYYNCDNSEELITTLLRNTGFINCRCYIEDRKYVYENFETLKKSVLAVNPTLLQLNNPIDRTAYIEDIVKEIKNTYKYPWKFDTENINEEFPTIYRLITIYASKPRN